MEIPNTSTNNSCNTKQSKLITNTFPHKKPRVSIITVVFNGEQHLEETIQSIISQTYENFEYIIIDGGSTDTTLKIIEKYAHQIDYWISEKDQGISDAFNKGVLIAKGDYINFQGDGDGFFDKKSLAKIMYEVDMVTDIFVSGRVQRISPIGDKLYLSRYEKNSTKNLYYLRCR